MEVIFCLDKINISHLYAAPRLSEKYGLHLEDVFFHRKTGFNKKNLGRPILGVFTTVKSWESKGNPPMPLQPENKALTRP